ncbi:hypothetical protein MD535_22375 [Vibrio sp. ZSDZ65]|uniref:Conjugal transfer protein TrbC n=1 Tax=Vibrio qingdaonensis TaxID=2829491 RepID=A0A9X3HYT6_9VIBR|nr:hypothetical protein [Vibrio qingdaonensis]MCW8348739.1 hypothetical protein [Vibrio qingdaonensis]
MIRLLTLPLMWLLSAPAFARVSLGTSTGPFGQVVAFFQAIVDFLGGPGTLFVVFMALCCGIALWVFMPKQAGSALGWVFRGCIGAIALFSIGTVITWIQSF